MAALALLVAGCQPSKVDSHADPSELVDGLTSVSEGGVGFHPTALANGFVAVDDEARFSGGMWGSKKPVVNEHMRELVKRGVEALPSLLDHLSDERETRVVVRKIDEHFGGIWFSDEYVPRSRDRKLHPPGVNSGLKRNADKYTLRVGDLCYVIIGQIVNRGLNALRYQPTACQVINSPVETPALAAAVRKDWGGLTVEQHRQSLTLDALDRTSFSSPGAMARLCFYYPEDGETLALRLLGRPLYDHSRVWDFVSTQLTKEENPAEQRQLVEAFRQRNGQTAAETIPDWLYWIYWETDFERTEAFLEQQATASVILKELYPEYDPAKPRFVNAATLHDQAQLVAAVTFFESRKIDKAVFDLFVAAMQFDAGGDAWFLEELATACVARLRGGAYEEQLRSFCVERLEETERSPEGSSDRSRVDVLRKSLEQLEE